MGLFLEFWTCYFQIYSLFGFPEKCSGKGGKILNLVIQLIYGAPAKPSRESPMTHTFNFLYFPHFLWNQTCCLWWWSWFLILFFLKGIIYLVFTVSISPISFPTESLFFFFFFFVENLFSIKDQLSLDLGYYFRVELVLFVWLFGFRGNLRAVLGFAV